MSKLSKENRFLDFSDYGRSIAKIIAKLLLNTPITPVHVTFGFLIIGMIAMYYILLEQFYIVAILLVLKSIIDAVDGELARLRNTPSYVGRYLDSIFDLLLNFGFLYVIHTITYTTIWMTIIAFIAIQLQGTVYNYYYTILRNRLSGSDTTSRVKENSFPKAMNGESQKAVNFLYIIFKILYSGFDFIILNLDKEAQKLKKIPNWFMTIVSIYGLGFQLLIIGVMLIIGLKNYIILFIIYYSVFILFILFIRKIFLPINN
ncbi:MAG: CDP-alcohol phosphatidyltransferase family protein [Vicingaceae bacterium]|nr:CDP-alcohol phosphatidyltransferase family protein [Vicingaceae bacterium]